MLYERFRVWSAVRLNLVSQEHKWLFSGKLKRLQEWFSVSVWVIMRQHIHVADFDRISNSTAPIKSNQIKLLILCYTSIVLLYHFLKQRNTFVLALNATSLWFLKQQSQQMGILYTDTLKHGWMEKCAVMCVSIITFAFTRKENYWLFLNFSDVIF